MNATPRFAEIERAFRDGKVRQVTTAQAEVLGAESAFREACEAKDPGIGAIHADNDCIVLRTIAGHINELVELARIEFDRLNVARDITIPGFIQTTHRASFNAPMIAEMIAEAFEDALCGHAAGALVAQVREAK